MIIRSGVLERLVREACSQSGGAVRCRDAEVEVDDVEIDLDDLEQIVESNLDDVIDILVDRHYDELASRIRAP